MLKNKGSLMVLRPVSPDEKRGGGGDPISVFSGGGGGTR